MSRRWKIMIWVLVIGFVAGLPVVTHYRAKAAVERYRKQLQDRGEKLSIEELAPRISADRENGGPALLQALAMFYAPITNLPPTMRIVAPGHAVAAWAEVILPSENSTNIWTGLDAEIRARHDTLADVRAALRYPTIQFDLDYSQGWLTPLPHLAQMKKAEQWLSAATLLELHQGQASNAWEDLKLCVDEVRHYRCEPFMISHLVQLACGQIALSTTWETLQYPGWSDEQLAELQKSWEAVDYMEGTEAALSMEQVMMSQGMEELRSSYSNFTSMGSLSAGGPGGSSTAGNLGQILADPGKGFNALMERFPGYWGWKYWISYDEELYALQNLQATLDAARQARKEGAYVPALEGLNKAVAVNQQLHAMSQKQFAIATSETQSRTSFLTKIGDVEMMRRMLVTAIALKRYQLQHGEYPGRLADLTPQYLRELPMDVMDGKTLRYRTNNEGSFVLYSAGEDGKDDGGDPTPQGSAMPDNRYSPWWKGRDAVWPMPASAEETKVYEDVLTAKAKLIQETQHWHEGGVTKAPAGVSQPSGTNAKTN